ncbi:restriction endonuclease subunit S [Phosphitispora fastidiosa]|uniref:restriction endonuclease subunit S n=1 Tax=Phosphitispora fastidiosa TaxID=2837202 RepID=UPI001E59BB59|nr:restriction endonuclease subunit S [Phosphitispora fastidiosa]MBU7005880.1 type I restriction enzyme S subunit [Phosphitispora fastidiosa]
MNKKEKVTLVPKLRFPEFHSTGEWKKYRLIEVAERITQKVGDKSLTTLSISAGIGFVSQEEKFSRDISGKQYENYIYLKKGAFSYNKGNSKKFPQGCIYELKEFEEAAVPNAFISFRFNDDYVSSFYKGYFDNNFHGKQLARFITSSARSDGLLNISPSDFFSIVLPTPKEKSEQQKIADCLSSLDDLITVEDKKLEALKMHKKGLMQKLFPADGATVPEWRFPEFRASGEWELRQFRDFAKVTTGNKDTQNKVDNGKYPFFVRSQTVEKIDTYTFDCEAILTSGDGVGVGKNFHYIVGKFDFHQRVYCIYNFEDTVSGKFVYQYFSEHFKKRVMQLSAKNSVDSVRMSMVTDMPIYIPKLKEQQKVADCLSSLDDLITAQAEKIEVLKLHKKGLMQGLFPSAKEVGE